GQANAGSRRRWLRRGEDRVVIDGFPAGISPADLVSRVAAHAVAAPVQVVDVRTDHGDWTLDVGRAVAAPACTVHVTGDGDAPTAVVRITGRLRLQCRLGADRDHFGDRLFGDLRTQQLSAGLHTVGQRYLVGKGLHPGDSLGSEFTGALGKRRILEGLRRERDLLRLGNGLLLRGRLCAFRRLRSRSPLCRPLCCGAGPCRLHAYVRTRGEAGEREKNCPSHPPHPVHVTPKFLSTDAVSSMRAALIARRRTLASQRPPAGQCRDKPEVGGTPGRVRYPTKRRSEIVRDRRETLEPQDAGKYREDGPT